MLTATVPLLELISDDDEALPMPQRPLRNGAAIEMNRISTPTGESTSPLSGAVYDLGACDSVNAGPRGRQRSLSDGARVRFIIPLPPVDTPPPVRRELPEHEVLSESDSSGSADAPTGFPMSETLRANLREAPTSDNR